MANNSVTDFHNPKQEPYVYRKFPRMLYRAKSMKIVNNEEELAQALADGYSKSPIVEEAEKGKSQVDELTEHHLAFIQSRGYPCQTMEDLKRFALGLYLRGELDSFMADAAAWVPPTVEVEIPTPADNTKQAPDGTEAPKPETTAAIDETNPPIVEPADAIAPNPDMEKFEALEDEVEAKPRKGKKTPR